MDRKFYIISAILIFATILTFTFVSNGQRPMMREGRPPEWFGALDANKNGRVEQEEFRAAADLFFKKFDADSNGVLEASELPPPPREGRPPLSRSEVPPFVFLKRGEVDLARAEFDERANLRFIEADANADRMIDLEEIKSIRPPDKEEPFPNKATAQFIGAEMRFGDKVVKNAPFSAETVREESKRLFDGTLVKNQSVGAIYRDVEGRVRQEQPFERIGGFPITATDGSSIKLVQIIDFTVGDSFSLNTATKRYSRIPTRQNSPLTPRDEPKDAKKEPLGKQTIEGVTAEGTRTTIEIPAGQIGNDKPIYIVIEKWFSPELQMVILSKHTDPFIGEVTFRLVKIKLGEPSSELFKIPADYQLLTDDRNRQPNDGNFRKGRKPL